MAIIFNSTEIKDAVMFNNVDLDKVYYNGTLVWEKWRRHTGNLVTMISNNSPSPFTCSSLCSHNGNHPEYAFNGVITNRVYTLNKFEDIGHFGTICELNFGKSILIHTMEIVPYIYDIGGSGVPQGARAIACYGITESNAEIEICRIDEGKGCQINTNESSTSKTTYNRTSSNQTTPFRGIRWKVADDVFQGRYGMYSCKITGWSDKS